MTAADRKQQREAIAYWRQSAERDWKAAQDNFKSQHYDWALFIAHLAVEKCLKALVIQIEKEPPFTHDLVRLATLAKLAVPKDIQEWLPVITDFNISARYDYEKEAFYRRATKPYSIQWLARCEKVIQWLQNQSN